jgi:WD40 repeat protein
VAVVRDLAFDLTGQRIVSSGRDGRVILWDTIAGTRLAGWQFPGRVDAVAFANDGRHIAVGNASGTIYILRLPSPLRTAGAG